MECRKSIRRSLRPWTRPFLGSLHWVTGGLPKPPRLETPGMMQSNCELHGSVVVVFQVCPGRKAFPDVILNAAESELNVLSTCVCLNIYSVLFYSLNLTFFIIVRSILQFQTHPDIISNCHKLIVYPIDIHWLYSFISHITIVAVYPPFSKRFFQLHPTSSIVAPNGPAVIAEGPLRAGALIFSLYCNYITIVFLIIYPIYIPNFIRLYDCPHYHPNISHYIVRIAYHSYSCCQHTSILVSFRALASGTCQPSKRWTPTWRRCACPDNIGKCDVLGRGICKICVSIVSYQ